MSATIYKTGNAQWLLALATAGASWSHAGAGFLDEAAQEPRSQPLVVEAVGRQEAPRSWLRGPFVLPDVEPELARRVVVEVLGEPDLPRSWLRQPAIAEVEEPRARPLIIVSQERFERVSSWLREPVRVVEAVVEVFGRGVVSAAAAREQERSWLRASFVDVEAVALNPRPLVVPPEVPIEQTRSWLNASFVDVTEVQPEDPPPSGALTVQAEPFREQPRSWYRPPPLGAFDSGFHIDGRTEVALNAFGAITVYSDGDGNFYEISSPLGI